MDLRELVEPAATIGHDQLTSRVGELREGDFAVLVTGWGDRRGITEEFMKRFPYLGGDGARLLLEHGVAGVGIDALSIGGYGGPEVGEPSHIVLLGAGKVEEDREGGQEGAATDQLGGGVALAGVAAPGAGTYFPWIRTGTGF
jgi:kynurenine formamidase